jgi:hypothetical protein
VAEGQRWVLVFTGDRAAPIWLGIKALVSGFGAIRRVLGCKLEGLGGAIRRSSDRIQVQFCRNLRVSVRFLIPSYKTA